MGPRAHRDVDILRTVSLGSTEWRRARIHGHIVVIRVSAVWASQRCFGSLVSKEKEGIIVSKTHWAQYCRIKAALYWSKYSVNVFVSSWFQTEKKFRGCVKPMYIKKFCLLTKRSSRPCSNSVDTIVCFTKWENLCHLCLWMTECFPFNT